MRVADELLRAADVITRAWTTEVREIGADPHDSAVTYHLLTAVPTLTVSAGVAARPTGSEAAVRVQVIAYTIGARSHCSFVVQGAHWTSSQAPV